MLYLAIAVLIASLILARVWVKQINLHRSMWIEELIDKHLGYAVVALMGKAYHMKKNNGNRKLTDDEKDFLSSLAIDVASRSIESSVGVDITLNHCDEDLGSRVATHVVNAKSEWRLCSAVDEGEQEEEEEEDDGDGWKKKN